MRTATRDRLDHVKLDIQTSGDTVTIDANKRDDSWEHHDDNVVETAFTIKLPKNANLDVDVFSSAVNVAGVSGRHHVHGFSSELRVTGSTGPIDAETFSGAIHACCSSSQIPPTLFTTITAATTASPMRALAIPSPPGRTSAPPPAFATVAPVPAPIAPLTDAVPAIATWWATHRGDPPPASTAGQLAAARRATPQRSRR